ncbi:hypothetical protein [Polyangium mundeleinium]|uniref:Uncharacterized protein n=1 Tax=Polyangium mundeleinium TaxID=2995306 RepID=A0ABT5F0B8_9BACT|nr:hypothetical protein [Polyangium mundeleinium]MDC0746962.1 hypothetical protein [Polyangium mundeleinium]
MSRSLDLARTFAEDVVDFRRIEAEFVARVAENEFDVLEARRRIAEHILSAAQSYHAPFEVCREAWNDLVRLGFTEKFMEYLEARIYADCCAYDEKPEEGLAVLEPLLAELERRREERMAAQQSTDFQDHYIEYLGDLRDELLAQQRGQLSPGRITRRMDEAYQPTPEEEKIDALYGECRKACGAAFKVYANSPERSFAEAAADYERIEADIVARAGEGEAFQAFVHEVKQEVAEDILRAACWLKQPFEVCRDRWNEVVRLGFSSIGQRCWMTKFYAESCGFNQKPEEGLAVLEPLLAEFERGLEAEIARRSEARAKLEPPGDAPSPSFYRDWINSLGELRDKLEAQRKGP